MKEVTRNRVATAVLIAGVAGALTFPVMGLVAGAGSSVTAGDIASLVLSLAVLVGVGLLGRLIVSRTGNPIGWIFLAGSAAAGIAFATDGYVQAAFRPVPRDLPLVPLAGWLSGVAILVMVLPLAILLVLFPTGRPRSARWRWLVPLWWAGVAFVLTWATFRPAEVYGTPRDGDLPSIHIDNPMPILLPTKVAQLLLTVGVAAVLTSGFFGLVTLLLRFKDARGEERQQLRWISFDVTLGVLLFLFLLVADALGVQGSRVEDLVWAAMALLLLVGVPLTVAIAVLKYRLYEIDVVIRKTLVYAILAGFISIVYVAIVVGLGSLFSGDLVLSIVATAVVAVAFQPVRERANRLANRLVYGKRATPYEVLARFSERVGGTYATEDVLPRTARVIAEGTGSERVEIWLHLGDAWRREATWPTDGDDDADIIEGGEMPASASDDRMVPVRHQGELLGALTVRKSASEPLTPAASKLLDDLAGQAGLVLSNVRLTAELQARLDEISGRAAELRASRQRIVATQDAERRRLERNIHDGAQQHLVALAVKLRLARQILQKDPVKGAATLREIRAQVAEGIETLTALALGIYPPILEERGLVAALEAHGSAGTLPIRVHAAGLGRMPIELEAAVYFVCLEALQNAAKYARASAVQVRLRRANGELRFEVSDDGSGFDPASNGGGTGLTGMRDRLEVFGGTVTVGSRPGEGTTVRGEVPVPRERVAR